MAGWSHNLSNYHQILIEAIFNTYKIGCKAEIFFIPRDSQWMGYFKTKFKYLSIDESRKFSNDFLLTHHRFFNQVEEITHSFKKEYDRYFNELWC